VEARKKAEQEEIWRKLSTVSNRPRKLKVGWTIEFAEDIEVAYSDELGEEVKKTYE
jgi:hypothetical protein